MPLDRRAMRRVNATGISADRPIHAPLAFDAVKSSDVRKCARYHFASLQRCQLPFQPKATAKDFVPGSHILLVHPALWQSVSADPEACDGTQITGKGLTEIVPAQ